MKKNIYKYNIFRKHYAYKNPYLQSRFLFLGQSSRLLKYMVLLLSRILPFFFQKI